MSRERIWTPGFTMAFVAHFWFSLGFWTFLHLPGYLEGLGGSKSEIGAIMGSLSISAIVIRPWLGRIMDRRGRRPIIILGAVINLLTVSAYLTIDTISPWIYVIRIAHGIGQAALFSVMFTVAADVVPASRRTEGLAIFGVSGLVPLSLGSLLGDWILERWTYSMLFVAATAIALVTLLLCLPIAETRPERDESKPMKSLIQVLLRRRLLPLWLLTCGFSFGMSSYFTFIKTFIKQAHVGSVGLFFLAYSIASVLLRIFFSWVPDRVGPKQSLIPAILSLVAGIVLLSQADSNFDIIAAGALCGQGHAFVFPILSAMVINRAHADNRGAAMTLFTALFDVGALLGAPILGLVLEASDYHTMFSTAAVSVIALALVFFAIDRRNTAS